MSNPLFCSSDFSPSHRARSSFLALCVQCRDFLAETLQGTLLKHFVAQLRIVDLNPSPPLSSDASKILGFPRFVVSTAL